MARRRLWAISIIAACGLFLIFYWNTENTVTIYQPQENDREAIIEAEKKEEIEAKLRKFEEDEEKKLEKIDEANISFRGDIKIPAVNIEVNGHSIAFSNVETRPLPGKINIHLIFHSHVDPGWLETFEEYYQKKVKNILTNAVESLDSFKDLRFIWSETSFLERWWKDASDSLKLKITQQISSGQLEISGGAWVMTDEATPTFYAAIQNMIEGHYFIHQKFNITPRTSWSVDPFGHGAMMPELLHRAGIEAMVIGRFHEHIKENLRAKQSMKWQWIPPYFQNLEGPRVNSLPHMVYTTEDACEDHSICMCYHVGPSALYQARCPGQKLLHKMTEENVDFMVKRFVDQMRLSQKMYGSEDLLVPIGDDFYFGDAQDWQQMYKGYAKMIEWLKNHPEVNATMKFSTVSEFFDAIKDEKLSTLRGDFFPYTSNMANNFPWWTGYFVQRPYTKIMERQLQNSLRNLDILTMLSPENVNLDEIRMARRQLTLFQHHDGITGTSKPLVMEDYEKRMLSAFKTFTKEYLKIVTNGKGNLTFDGTTNKENLIKIPSNKKQFLSVFSSQTISSKVLLRLLTDKRVKIETKEGEEIQISVTPRGGHFLTEFFAILPPLSISSFIVSENPTKNKKESGVKCIKMDEKTGNIEGLLFENNVVPLNITFFEVKDNGGAYTFMASGQRRQLFPNISTEYSSAPFQRVEFSNFPAQKQLKLSATCLGGGEVQLEVETDLTDGSTLILALKSEIKQKSFNTDVNGLYHIPRKYQKLLNNRNLPWEANIYPVATSVFVEDDSYRLTVAAGQPTGAIADEEGVLELLVDRRVHNDDGKGLGYNDCFDTRSSTARYRFLLEKRLETEDIVPSHSFLSLKGENTVMETLYPPIMAISETEMDFDQLKKVPVHWPCSIQLVSWRLLADKIGILILRKYNVDSMIIDTNCQNNSYESLYDYFSSNYKAVYHTKLSAMVDDKKVTLQSFKNSLEQPFSIAAFRLHY